MNGPESGSLQTVRGYPDGMSIQEQIGIGGRLPEGKTSIFWAIFLVVNAALGAGLLTFPLSFYMTGGIVSGIVIELVRVLISIPAVAVIHRQNPVSHAHETSQYSPTLSPPLSVRYHVVQVITVLPKCGIL